MPVRYRIGVLTPSSNTVLEPMTSRMLADAGEVSVHFSRFKVTEISLSDTGLAQFDDRPIIAAAELLAHAKVDAIVWSGTSAAWLGFDRDERLCVDITTATGIAAGTSMLAMRDVLIERGLRRVGLVSPYTDDVQQRIVANWRSVGIDVVAERHFAITDNFSYAAITEDRVAAAMREVATEPVEAVLVLCTNMTGASIVPALEAELGRPILDSIATGAWEALRLLDVPHENMSRWGTLFAA
jgi:maleate isomerase